jgi:hypothetical protein
VEGVGVGAGLAVGRVRRGAAGPVGVGVAAAVGAVAAGAAGALRRGCVAHREAVP